MNDKNKQKLIKLYDKYKRLLSQTITDYDAFIFYYSDSDADYSDYSQYSEYSEYSELPVY